MKISFVTDGSVSEFWQDGVTKITRPDLLVFGFNGLGLVSYKKELTGDTEYFGEVARLSKNLDCTVVCGCDTDTYGVFRHSTVVADKGKILGVSDATRSIGESEFSAGGNLRVYQTSAGRIGVVVGEDLYFPEVISSLSNCDAELIVCIFKTLSDIMPQILIRAYAFSNGVDISLCAKNYFCISDAYGKIAYASAKDTGAFDLQITKEYTPVTTLRRGLKKDYGVGR